MIGKLLIVAGEDDPFGGVPFEPPCGVSDRDERAFAVTRRKIDDQTLRDAERDL